MKQKKRWSNKAKAIKTMMQSAIARGDDERVAELKQRLSEELGEI